MSRGVLTVSAATSLPPASQQTAHFAPAGSPRHTTRSASPCQPTYCTMRPNCSDQKYGTGSYGSLPPSNPDATTSGGCSATSQCSNRSRRS